MLCKASPLTCPVHTFGKLAEKLPPNTSVFKGVTAKAALLKLREFLTRLGIDKANEYGTHGFRRGHAQDLVESGRDCSCVHCFYVHLILCLAGAPLQEILRAGEWRSPTFMTYLDLALLEPAAVVEAALLEESDSDSDS